jgi:hypothetical protein
VNRSFSRAAAAIVALMLALSPVYAAAQSTGTQAGGGPTSHGVFGLHLSWIAVGAVVLIVLMGLVAMSRNGTTTTTVRRE